MLNIISSGTQLHKNLLPSSSPPTPHSIPGDKLTLFSPKKESTLSPPKMSDDSKLKVVASLLESPASLNNVKSGEDDLPSRERPSDDHRDDGDDDDDDDDSDDEAEHLEDGSSHGAMEGNTTPTPGTSIVNMAATDRGSVKPKVVKKRKKRTMKPKDYPKRPLSAYNIFFKQTREKNLKANGKLSFQEMVKTVAAQWKDITPEQKAKYQNLANEDLARYKKAVGVYERDTLEKNRIEREARKKAAAEEEEEKDEAKKEATSYRTSFPPSGPSDNGIDRGGWDERAFPSGNPYSGKSMFSSDRAAMNPSSLIDGVTGTGLGSIGLAAAHNRIQDDLQSMEETRAIRLRCIELAQAAGISPASALAALQQSGDGGLLGRHMQQVRQQMFTSRAGAAPAANEAEIRERLAMMRHPDIVAEHETRLLQEARLAALGHSGFSALMNPTPPFTGNPFEDALMREHLVRRQELLFRAGIGGGGGADPLAGYSGSVLHSALGGGFGSSLGSLGGAQPFADVGYGGSARGGLSSLEAAYDQRARLGMGMAGDRLAALGRFSEEDLLRAITRQVQGNNLSYPSSLGEGRNTRMDPPE
jgi:hypothetical protein